MNEWQRLFSKVPTTDEDERKVKKKEVASEYVRRTHDAHRVVETKGKRNCGNR